MSNPFLGEVRAVSFNFAPKGWALCNGQLLPINQNQALFAILGTAYGGDGRVTFALPNLQGRVPVHTGNTTALGAVGGEANHTLTLAEMPTHGHMRASVNQATAGSGGGNVLAAKARRGVNYYAPGPGTVLLNDNSNTGGSQPHSNLQPYLVVNFVIALVGVFPSRN